MTSPKRVYAGVFAWCALLVFVLSGFGALIWSEASSTRQLTLDSCRHTYEGVREVLLPFFPPPPRTAKQQQDVDKFNRTVNRLKRGCH